MSDRDDEGLDELDPLSPEDEQAISALLGSLPSEPMPADVFARIEAVLAAEPAPVPLAPVVSLHAARSTRSSRGPMILKVAASVVGLVGAVALGLAVVQGSGSTSSGGSTADSAGGGAKSAEAASSAAAASAPASGAAGAASNPTVPAAGQRARLSQTGHTYDVSNLGTAAAALVTASSLPSPPPVGPAASTSAAGSLSGAPTSFSAEVVATNAKLLDACVKEITDGDGRTPIAVDVGQWGGQPALVIVLPAAGDPSSLEVFAVRPTCGSVPDSSDILQFVKTPRP